MILQALQRYYERMANDPDSGIAPLGWERKELPYLIVIASDGSLVQVEDTQETVGKKKRAKSFLVPQSIKRSVGVAPNLLWDNVEYVTGVVCKGAADRVEKLHKAFLARLDSVADCQSIRPVFAFLRRESFRDELSACSEWSEACKTNAFVSFKVCGCDGPVFSADDIVAKVNASENVSEKLALCLVSGEQDVLAETHPAIKGVNGANTTGGNIVSFNFDAAKSFGKEQGANSPIGKRSAFEYTTALNALLSKDSRQKLSVGDATMVFWASEKVSIEDDMLDFFGEPPKDSPNRGVDAVERLFKSVETGSGMTSSSDARFYVLGLSPNAARISVRFWHDGTVPEMAGRFCRWFDDLRIAHGPNDREHLSLWKLLVSTATLGKSENISPHLAGDVMRAILDDAPLPQTLLSQTILRIKAEHEVSYPRAKLIKAALNRKLKVNNPNNERMLTVSLDKENTNVGYRLGRLFATLEKIQQEVNSGVNATIRDKFYAGASSTPVTVFANLMRLKNHHISKLSKGRAIFFEKLIGEIIYNNESTTGVTSFPAHLSLDEQGQFAIGYYHQRQDFFTKSSEATGKDSPASENQN